MNTTPLTLGELIQALAKLPAGLPIETYVGLGGYRGYNPDNHRDEEALALYSWGGQGQHDGSVGGLLALLLNVELPGLEGRLANATSDLPVYLAYDETSTGCPRILDVRVTTSAVTDETEVTLFSAYGR